MIQIITTKNGMEELIEMKTIDDKFFEFLFCDSQYLKSITIEGLEQNIESLKVGYEYKRADVVRNRINTLIMLKHYFTDKKSIEIINKEILELRI
jgi:hypothetical protein